MRCWECHCIIPLPDIINGRPGVAGSIRAGDAEAEPFTPQVITIEVGCHRCRSQYHMTVSKLPVKSAVIEPPVLDEREKERGKLWKSQDTQ